MKRDRRQLIGVGAAAAIGIGGMIGAGIFSILGVVAEISGTALPIAFIVGALVALPSVYSYIKLGTRYPTVGGAVQFLVQGFGDRILSGGLNIFQYVAYVIALALYARGFAGYAATFFPGHPPSWLQTALAIGVVLLFVGINFIGTKAMGKAESTIVTIKVSILVLFGIAGLFFMDPSRLAISGWNGPVDILFAAGVLFIGYEGFGLVTNAAGHMRKPKLQLPKAMYLALAVTVAIYVLVSVSVVGNVSIPAMVHAQDYALAVAAQPFLGEIGFRIIAVAALLSTASAVNATLFGAANVSYQVAKDGQLPTAFVKTLWDRNVEGLFITAGLVIALVAFLDLAPIAMMGSAAFLLVYFAVNAAHLRVARQTGAKRPMIVLAMAMCLVMFGLLLYYIVQHAPAAAWVMLVAFVLSFVVEAAYRRFSGRRLKLRME